MVIRPLDDDPHDVLNLWSMFVVRGGQGWAHSVARPWVPITSSLTHMVYLVPFLSYLAGSKSVSARPSDPDTMTNDKYRSTKLSIRPAAKSKEMLPNDR